MSPRTSVTVGFLVSALLFGSAGSAFAQTAAPQPKAPATDANGVPYKSKRLDKHAAPWTVIWNTRLWTDVPQTQDFVKATHPDPKSLDYAPLVGKDPDRPKPRDAKGIEALRAELEGDIKRNEARGRTVTPVAPISAATPAATPKSAGGRRAKRAAKAKSTKSSAGKTASSKSAAAPAE